MDDMNCLRKKIPMIVEEEREPLNDIPVEDAAITTPYGTLMYPGIWQSFAPEYRKLANNLEIAGQRINTYK